MTSAQTVRRVILLVGMGRSGTSAFARVLAHAGGALALDLMPANFANPTGYWEPQRAVDLNDRFLHVHRSSWYDARLAPQVRPPDSALGRAFVAALAEFLQSGFEADGPIVLKDPRISALLPHWAAAANAAGLCFSVVQVVRNPADVAASLAARDALDAESAFALWLKYNLLAERDSRTLQRTIVHYEDLMRDGRRVAERCIAGLGLPLAIGDDASRAIANFLSPELHHHHDVAVAPGAVNPALRRLVERVYGVLCDAPDGAQRAAELDAVIAECAASALLESFGSIVPKHPGREAERFGNAPRT